MNAKAFDKILGGLKDALDIAKIHAAHPDWTDEQCAEAKHNVALDAFAHLVKSGRVRRPGLGRGQ